MSFLTALIIIAKIQKKKAFQKNERSEQLPLLNQNVNKLNLKPASTITGFKKLMYSSVKVNQNRLHPGYNRRKYNHSHFNQTLKESSNLSKIYAYLSKRTLKNYCAYLSRIVNSRDHSIKTGLHYKQSGLHRTKPYHLNRKSFRPIPGMLNLLESRLDSVFWKNQLSPSIRSSRQKIRNGAAINSGLERNASYLLSPGEVFRFE